MSIEIDSVCAIAKGMAVKREKQPDKTDATIAHLAFSHCLISRETIDELLGLPIGWSQRALFDDLGAPYVRMTLGIEDIAFEINGTIKGNVNKGEIMRFSQGTLASLSIELRDKGALVSGEITWKVAGDEVSDVEPMLAQTVACHFVLLDPRQADLLVEAAQSAERLKAMAKADGATVSLSRVG